MRLIRLRKREDASEFEAVLRPHVPYLFRLAYHFCRDRHDAEDLVQDLLIKLFPRTRELAALDRIRPWLARALYHQYVDYARRRARSALHQPAELPGEAPEDDPLDALPCPRPGPEDEAQRASSSARLQGALAGLSPDHRALLVLHDVEGYTLQELSPLLDIPLGTLKSRLHRARAALRERLAAMEPSAAFERVAQ